MKTSNKKQKGKQSKKALRLSDGLWLLVSLLNANSESGFRKEMYRQGGDLLGFYDRWAKDAWCLRDKILQYVSPLIGPRGQLKHVETLVKKINGIDLKPFWGVWPASRILWTIKSRETQSLKVDNLAYQRLGPGQGVLKIGKHKCMVTMSFNNLDSPERYFYGILAEALREGQFSRLKRCDWKDCKKFFIAYDRRRTAYCTDECAKAYDTDDAKYRVEKWRQSNRES